MAIIIRRKVIAPVPEPVIAAALARPALDGLCRAVMAIGRTRWCRGG